MQNKVDDFRLKLGDKEYVPIMIGGMGVDISTSDLALEASRLGGIGHISDAMSPSGEKRKGYPAFHLAGAVAAFTFWHYQIPGIICPVQA